MLLAGRNIGYCELLVFLGALCTGFIATSSVVKPCLATPQSLKTPTSQVPRAKTSGRSFVSPCLSSLPRCQIRQRRKLPPVATYCHLLPPIATRLSNQLLADSVRLSPF
ncbi:hypothetical protein F5883DRAFT_49745 [Diaporthe sp. PMI_573]|nr:hypothetical protein F5883DRAFT_49745 [Diaporthaceae sp. PMI_573]